MFKFVLFTCFLLSVIGKSCQTAIVENGTPSLSSFIYKDKHFSIKFHNDNQKTVYFVEKFGRVLHQVHLNEEFGRNFSTTIIENGFVAHGEGQNIKFEILEDSEDVTVAKVSRTLKADQVASDCFELFPDLNLFGGAEQWFQYWPIENSKFEDYSYLTKEKDSVGVAERYWLHSRGEFIYVNDDAPLFLDQNVNGRKICFKVQNKLPYNVRRDTFDFTYYIGGARDSKTAHMKAVERFLNKPSDVPDKRMIEHPIWSTWARYKRDINESTVLEFAEDILKYGFNNSQLEIDDDWEVCYGALTFRESKFPNIRSLTDRLKADGFRVTLWIHPFINKGCEPWYSDAKSKGYFSLSIFIVLISDFECNSIN